MAAHPPRSTLVLIDFINDIVHPDGKLAGRGTDLGVQTTARMAQP